MVRKLLVLILVLSIVGCVSSTRITRRSIDYNRVIEQTYNEMFLLNVLRAKDRSPMYFSGLSNVTGKLSAEARFGVKGSVGGDALDVYEIAPGVTVSDSPSFNIENTNKLEFIRGITTPIKVEQLHYYLEQGWPREMLFTLAIRKIVIEGEEEYVNYPWSDSEKACTDGSARDIIKCRTKSFEDFQTRLRTLLNTQKLDIIESPEEECVGPELDGEKIVALGDLLKIPSSGLRLKKRGNGKYCLQEKPQYVFRFKKDACDTSKPKNAQTEIILSTSGEGHLQDSSGKNKIYLRSPEAMLYYLGELARGQELSNYTWIPTIEFKIKTEPNKWIFEETPLFTVLRRDEKDCAMRVAVDYGGKTYFIPEKTGPDCDPGRSMHVLSLVSQLLLLNQSSKDFPATGAIRVIAQ